MTTTYDLFGAKAAALEEIRSLLEAATGRRLALHESDHRGGLYYRCGALDGEHIVLQRNYDDTEAEWTEEQHQDSPFLIYVNDSPQADALRNMVLRIDVITHLRRETY